MIKHKDFYIRWKRYAIAITETRCGQLTCDNKQEVIDETMANLFLWMEKHNWNMPEPVIKKAIIAYIYKYSMERQYSLVRLSRYFVQKMRDDKLWYNTPIFDDIDQYRNIKDPLDTIKTIEDKMDFASFRKMSLKMLRSESSTSARVLEEFLNPDNELSIRELCRKFGLGCHGITYMIDKFRKQISKYYSKEDIFG